MVGDLPVTRGGCDMRERGGEQVLPLPLDGGATILRGRPSLQRRLQTWKDAFAIMPSDNFGGTASEQCD